MPSHKSVFLMSKAVYWCANKYTNLSSNKQKGIAIPKDWIIETAAEFMVSLKTAENYLIIATEKQKRFLDAEKQQLDENMAILDAAVEEIKEND